MIAALIAGALLGAPEYLDRVESPVYEAQGDRAALTKRAIICANQVLKPGQVSAPTVLSSDPEAGVLVANNAFRYSSGLLQATARTTLTFQAKDGRFRIINTDIEQLLTGAGSSNSWTRIGLWKFSGGEKARTRINEISDALAACVKTGSTAGDDW